MSLEISEDLDIDIVPLTPDEIDRFILKLQIKYSSNNNDNNGNNHLAIEENIKRQNSNAVPNAKQ